MSVEASCSYTRWPNLEKALGESKGKIGSRGFRGRTTNNVVVQEVNRKARRAKEILRSFENFDTFLKSLFRFEIFRRRDIPLSSIITRNSFSFLFCLAVNLLIYSNKRRNPYVLIQIQTTTKSVVALNKIFFARINFRQRTIQFVENGLLLLPTPRIFDFFSFDALCLLTFIYNSKRVTLYVVLHKFIKMPTF